MKNFLIIIGVTLAGFFFWFNNTLIGQSEFNECKIGDYSEYIEVQYVGTGSYAFIGKKGDKYYVVKDGKEGPGFDSIYGLRYSPDGSRWAALGGNGKDLENFSYLIIDGKLSDIKYYKSDLESVGMEANQLFLFSPDSRRFAYIEPFRTVYHENRFTLNLDGKDLYLEKNTGRKINGEKIYANIGRSADENYITIYQDEIIYTGIYERISGMRFSDNSADIYFLGENLEEGVEDIVKNGVNILTKKQSKDYISGLAIDKEKSKEQHEKSIQFYSNFSERISFYMSFGDATISQDGKSYLGEVRDIFLGSRLGELGEKKVCKSSITFLEGVNIFGKENKWLLLFLLVIIVLIYNQKSESERSSNYNTNTTVNKNPDPEYQAKITRELEERRLSEERKKQQEEERKRMEIINRRKKFVPDNYLRLFLQHAERKYGKKDKYGNQDKHTLDREINDYLLMIAKQRGNRVEQNAVDNYIRGRNYPPLDDDYKWLIGYLRSEFEKYYQEKQNRLGNGDIVFSEMSGVEFERYLGKIFEQNGYAVDLTPESGDQGADVIAEKNGRRLVIQAKKYSNSVGNGAVQEVIGAIRYYDGDEGWVITNSTFTNSAKELAHVNRIRLIDGYELEKIDEILGGKGQNAKISVARLKKYFQGILTDEEMNDYESFKDKLKTILGELTPRQKGIIIMRFGLDGIDIYSIEAVAKEYKISTEVILDIESKALALARNVV